MDNFNKNIVLITALLNHYFEGIHNGDVKLLKSVFHEKALIVGDVNGNPYFKTVGEYLEGVGSRKSPKELGESFRMEIISVEVINKTAVAKARVPIFDFNYYDQLSLAIVDGKWVIVNKLLTNVKND